MADITLDGAEYVVKFGYDQKLVERIKYDIPQTGRAWDKDKKCWRVATSYVGILRDIFPGDTVPAAQNVVVTSQRYNIDLRYIGQVKQRDDGTMSSYGWSRKSWSVVFPEKVLREWFEGTEAEPKLNTASFYGTLGVSDKAGDDEIKAGYRRMSKQWHPDVCREPNASEMFQVIKEAYETLKDPDLKSRYDVGLHFEKRSGAPKRKTDGWDAFKPLLRCGLLGVEGKEMLGRLFVSKIYSWDDIIDGNGRTLVTSWVKDSDIPTEMWF